MLLRWLCGLERAERPARRVVGLVTVALLLAGACGPASSPGRQAAPAAPEASPTAEVDVKTAATATPRAVVSAPTAPPAVAASAGPAEHDGERAMEHVRALAERIGPRVAGTPGEEATLRYIQEQLAAWGYHVEARAFSFSDPFQQGSVRFDDQQVAAWPMAGSAAGRVSGQAVDAGLARAEDMAGLELRGKVAIARRGEIAFREKLANVQAAGATALVVVNSQPGRFLGNLGRKADIPALGVRAADGPSLQAAAQAGRTVTVQSPGEAVSRSANVLATAGPGVRCEVLVGAHHDTVPRAPGAKDNASGTANVLELARAFAADGLDEGLCFATFGAEESGLHGSRTLATSLQAEGALPRTMVNLDVTGGGSQVQVIGSDDLVGRVVDLAAQSRIPARAAQMPAASGSDHQSFARMGVPVLFFTSGHFETIHTPQDTVDRLYPADLDRVGDLAFATVAALLQEPDRAENVPTSEARENPG